MFVNLSRLVIAIAVFTAIVMSSDYIHEYIWLSQTSQEIDRINSAKMNAYEAWSAKQFWAYKLWGIWAVCTLAAGCNMAAKGINTARAYGSYRFFKRAQTVAVES